MGVKNFLLQKKKDKKTKIGMHIFCSTEKRPNFGIDEFKTHIFELT